MTSKKALEELERINSRQNNGKGDVWLEMVIDGIKKDLEVLNIIKNKQVDIQDIIEVEGDFEFYHSYCIGKEYADEYICNKEEFKKINRWLENDR